MKILNQTLNEHAMNQFQQKLRFGCGVIEVCVQLIRPELFLSTNPMTRIKSAVRCIILKNSVATLSVNKALSCIPNLSTSRD